jgi:hypothetical protein
MPLINKKKEQLMNLFFGLPPTTQTALCPVREVPKDRTIVFPHDDQTAVSEIPAGA